MCKEMKVARIKDFVYLLQNAECSIKNNKT